MCPGASQCVSGALLKRKSLGGCAGAVLESGSGASARLGTAEVPESLHRAKHDKNLGSRDNYYVDKEGNLYSGSEDGGELTYEGHRDDWAEDDW